MSSDASPMSEIESFNLADLDVSALDVRLELTALLPHNFPGCDGFCSANFTCRVQGVCPCNVLR
jgi:hypothetical protein